MFSDVPSADHPWSLLVLPHAVQPTLQRQALPGGYPALFFAIGVSFNMISMRTSKYKYIKVGYIKKNRGHADPPLGCEGGSLRCFGG